MSLAWPGQSGLLSLKVSSLIISAFSVLIIFGTAQLVRRLLRRITIANFKRQHGCEDVRLYPRVGTLRAEALKNGRVIQFLDEQHDHLGKTFATVEHGKTTIYTTSHVLAQHVFALDFHKFAKQNDTKEMLRVLGHGVMISDGAHWKRSRHLVRPTFARYEVGNMPLVEGHVNRFIDALPRDGSTINVQDMLKPLFLDIASESLFGESFDSQVPEKKTQGEAFIRAADECMSHLMLQFLKRINSTSWSERLRLNLFEDQSFGTKVTEVHEYLDGMIQKALQRTSQTSTIQDQRLPQAEEKADGLHGQRYILLDEMAKQIRDPILLREEIQNVFFGARDNTAILVSNALFQLARHPQHWSTLRRVALDLGPSPAYDFETLKSLTPVQHILQETLRTIGPGFQTRRTALQDLCLPEGGGPDGSSPLFVPKGQEITLHRNNMHHNRDFWGDDALEFNPERFEGLKTSWEFVPFSGGPRICPALNQAYVQATYVLVRMAREFERIENRDDVVEYVAVMKTVMQSKDGVQIALIPASSS